MRFTPVNLDSVFPCNSWFKWWVVGNFLADPSKVCPSHQRPLLRGLNRFFMIHAVRRTANDHSSVALPTDTDPWRRVLLLSMSIPAWQFLEYKLHCPLLAMITMENRIFLSCLTHSRECGCSIRLGLLAWQIDMWDHPCALEKNERLIHFWQWTHMKHLSDVFNIFQFSAVQIRSYYFLFWWCFLICDDVRSEYMSAHVRIDSSQDVGSPPLLLFVVVGLA